MLQLLVKIILWLRGGSLKLLTIAVLILLVWGTLSPVGTLIWWADEGVQLLGLKTNPKIATFRPNTSVSKSSQLNCYIVFLPGVGDFSANQLTSGEELFLDSLIAAHPNCIAVSDVFPYSAANESLGGQRVLAPLWKFADRAQGWLSVSNVVIKIRNLWRFAISADPRYAPIYNQGIATAIIERMNAQQAIPEKPQIILLGTSGGVQVALGAADYLKRSLKADIVIVSLGGVFAGTNGFKVSDRVYHLHGDRDWVENIGAIVFPSRWRWTVGSPFNQARLQNRYAVASSGAHAHDGAEGYFGENLSNKGVTYVDLTLQAVNQLPIWSAKK
ncbi:hypothetical protein [Synechocystis sp. PCC 7509]|uniref:hypothetical protein n=1 Tax=Synechocystis sp. PCC 7509 TaxID=927677 RepID=UPI0002AC57FC|nr:hypothetical protein [Synechocystis sp. PCC 7509]